MIAATDAELVRVAIILAIVVSALAFAFQSARAILATGLLVLAAWIVAKMSANRPPDFGTLAIAGNLAGLALIAHAIDAAARERRAERVARDAGPERRAGRPDGDVDEDRPA